MWYSWDTNEMEGKIMWHQDPEVDRAFTALMDALVTHERNTGRGSSLMLVPHQSDEDIVFVQDGKPLRFADPMDPKQFLENGLRARTA